MYTAPRCTDLTDTRFFLGPKIFYLHGFSQSCTVFPNKIIFGFKYTSNSKSKSKRTYSSLSIHFKISSRSRCLLNYLKASLEYNQNQPILKITSLHWESERLYQFKKERSHSSVKFVKKIFYIFIKERSHSSAKIVTNTLLSPWKKPFKCEICGKKRFIYS